MREMCMMMVLSEKRLLYTKKFVRQSKTLPRYSKLGVVQAKVLRLIRQSTSFKWR
jgi:hypothetical protein